MTINDSTLLIFKAITAFICDMNEVFGKDDKNLMLYSHLIEKTGIIHEEPIKKHITIFQKFVIDNEEAIFEKNIDLLKDTVVQYSDKVCIDIRKMFELSKESVGDCNSIWKHLLTLSALLNPTGQAKEILKRDKETEKNPPKEDDFLSGLIDKVGKHIDPTSTNPMDSMNSLMSSGVFGELMNSMDKGIGDGSLDMQKMVGSLQKMIGSLSTMMESDGFTKSS